MKTSEIRNLVEREPFRPFSVRLSNGAQYSFNEAREFGAPTDLHVIFFFGQSDWVLIDTEHVVEVIQNEVVGN